MRFNHDMFVHSRRGPAAFCLSHGIGVPSQPNVGTEARIGVLRRASMLLREISYLSTNSESEASLAQLTTR